MGRPRTGRGGGARAPRRTVVPAEGHLQALGPRPVDPDEHAVWLSGSRALESYRERWGATHAMEPSAAGDASTSVASMPMARLVDHLRTEQAVVAARARLGRRLPMLAERGLSR